MVFNDHIELVVFKFVSLAVDIKQVYEKKKNNVDNSFFLKCIFPLSYIIYGKICDTKQASDVKIVVEA